MSPPRRPRIYSLFTLPPPLPPLTLRALKICGIVSPSDAELAISIARPLLPSNTTLFIGTILWPHSRRSVTPHQARAIAAAAHANGATPVAVFVDESLSEIEAACHTGGFPVAQLHGPRCREAWVDGGGGGMNWIDVREVTPEGVVEEAEEVGEPLWRIYDAKGGGTGKAFDWERFKAPEGKWLLAGGLHPGNVSEAVKITRPAGVDVASGVAGEDRCKKDRMLLRLFVERLVEAYVSE